jgi:hypothetical protein
VETSTIATPRPLGRGVVARYWVLKEQPRALDAVASVPGSGLGATSPTCVVGLVVPVGGLGFGGVFVNWIVDASIKF